MKWKKGGSVQHDEQFEHAQEQGQGTQSLKALEMPLTCLETANLGQNEYHSREVREMYIGRLTWGYPNPIHKRPNTSHHMAPVENFAFFHLKKPRNHHIPC